MTTVLRLYRSGRRYTARGPQFRNPWHFVLLEAFASEDTEEENFPIFFFRVFFSGKEEKNRCILRIYGAVSVVREKTYRNELDIEGSPKEKRI